MRYKFYSLARFYPLLMVASHSTFQLSLSLALALLMPIFTNNFSDVIQPSPLQSTYALFVQSWSKLHHSMCITLANFYFNEQESITLMTNMDIIKFFINIKNSNLQLKIINL